MSCDEPALSPCTDGEAPDGGWSASSPSTVDCDDEDAALTPQDLDGDGFSTCDGDCDDDPAACGADCIPDDSVTDTCDDYDNNCDGDIDEGLRTAFYEDLDTDGFGSDESLIEACFSPEGYVEQGGDCDDLEVLAHPYAIEVCDTIDNNCDGNVDEEGAYGSFDSYFDGDGDGFGDDAQVINSCDLAANYVLVGGDCDDTASTAHPAGTEICDGLDNDCDGNTDDNTAVNQTMWYADADGDGVGDDRTVQQACNAPTGFVSTNGDCDDNLGLNDVTLIMSSPLIILQRREMHAGSKNECQRSGDQSKPQLEKLILICWLQSFIKVLISCRADSHTLIVCLSWDKS